MSEFVAKVMKLGSGLAIVIPKKVVEEFNLEKGNYVRTKILSKMKVEFIEE